MTTKQGCKEKTAAPISPPGTKKARQFTLHKTSKGKHFLHTQHLMDLRNLLHCCGTGLWGGC